MIDGEVDEPSVSSRSGAALSKGGDKAGKAGSLDKRGAKRERARLALELVALRGKDVVGVRHLLEGGKAWVGDTSEALVRLPSARALTRQIGLDDPPDSAPPSAPMLVGESKEGQHALHVPPRARARVQRVDGLWRLLVGPCLVPLGEGEKAVLVLGPIQIRARLVNVPISARSFRKVAAVIGWLAFLAAVYAAVVSACAALTPSQAHVEPAAWQPPVAQP